MESGIVEFSSVEEPLRILSNYMRAENGPLFDLESGEVRDGLTVPALYGIPDGPALVPENEASRELFNTLFPEDPGATIPELLGALSKVEGIFLGSAVYSTEETADSIQDSTGFLAVFLPPPAPFRPSPFPRFRYFDTNDYYSFAGVEGDRPEITYAEGTGRTSIAVIVDFVPAGYFGEEILASGSIGIEVSDPDHPEAVGFRAEGSGNLETDRALGFAALGIIEAAAAAETPLRALVSRLRALGFETL